jgi:hypothetical protein
MVDEEQVIQSVARHYGFSDEDAIAAQDLLNLPTRDLVVRFNGLAHFARQYGINILALARLIADTGVGVEPFTPGDISSEDWRRIRKAESRLARLGNWAETILKLLDEVAALEDQEGLGKD